MLSGHKAQWLWFPFGILFSSSVVPSTTHALLRGSLLHPPAPWGQGGGSLGQEDGSLMATTEHPCTSHTWSSSNPAPMPALLHWQTRHPGTASMGRRALLPLSCLCPAPVLPCVPAFPACQGDTDQGKSPWHWVLASSALCCGSSTHASTS